MFNAIFHGIFRLSACVLRIVFTRIIRVVHNNQRIFVSSSNFFSRKIQFSFYFLWNKPIAVRAVRFCTHFIVFLWIYFFAILNTLFVILSKMKGLRKNLEIANWLRFAEIYFFGQIYSLKQKQTLLRIFGTFFLCEFKKK